MKPAYGRVFLLRWAATVVVSCAGLFGVNLAHADRAAAQRGIQETTREIRNNPKNASAYVMRGIYHVQLQPDGYTLQNELFAAIADFEAAVKLEPNNFYALHNYADAAYRAGFQGFAVMEFTKALAINPKSAQSYMGRGFAKLMMAQDAEAQKDFDDALRLDPSLKTKLLQQVQNIRRGQMERRAAAQTVSTMQQMGKQWASWPTKTNKCEGTSTAQCRAYNSADYEAAGRFAMGNPSKADVAKYGN